MTTLPAPPTSTKPRLACAAYPTGKGSEMCGTMKTDTKRAIESRITSFLLPAHVQQHWTNSQVPMVIATSDGEPLAYTLLRYSSARRKLCQKDGTCTCGGKQVDIVQICVAGKHQRKGWGAWLALTIYRVAARLGRSMYLEECITTASQSLGSSLFRQLKGSKHGKQSYFYECGQQPKGLRDTPYRLPGLSVVCKNNQPSKFRDLYKKLMRTL
jgi:hypothetical protein